MYTNSIESRFNLETTDITNQLVIGNDSTSSITSGFTLSVSATNGNYVVTQNLDGQTDSDDNEDIFPLENYISYSDTISSTGNSDTSMNLVTRTYTDTTTIEWTIYTRETISTIP